GGGRDGLAGCARRAARVRAPGDRVAARFVHPPVAREVVPIDREPHSGAVAVLAPLLERSTEVPGAPAVRRLGTTPEDWHARARDVAATGARLLSIWTERAPAVVHAVFLGDAAVLVLDLALP